MKQPDENSFNPADFEDEIAKKDQENQYLRGRNFGLQDAAESNFMPKNDSNIIEYKLSSEELLDRIEHYLRGDILKTRINADKQMESVYSIPTKKISVGLYKIENTGQVFIVNEHPENQQGWDVLSVLAKQDGEEDFEETSVEDNYKPIILAQIKKGLE